MNTFGRVSTLPGTGSIPRRLLIQVGGSISGRLLSQGGSIPVGSLEGTGREVGVPVAPSPQAVSEHMDAWGKVLLCALICVTCLLYLYRCWPPCLFRSQRRCDTGLKKKAIKALPKVTYCNDLHPPEAGTDCPICLTEFEDGEKLRALPHFNHCFHMQCIDRWLRSHSSCPTCRNSLLFQVNVKPAAPSHNSQSIQLCESSGMQIPRAESVARVAEMANR